MTLRSITYTITLLAYDTHDNGLTLKLPNLTKSNKRSVSACSFSYDAVIFSGRSILRERVADGSGVGRDGIELGRSTTHKQNENKHGITLYLPWMCS